VPVTGVFLCYEGQCSSDINCVHEPVYLPGCLIQSCITQTMLLHLRQFCWWFWRLCIRLWTSLDTSLYENIFISQCEYVWRENVFFVREDTILYKMTDWIVINIPNIPSFSPFRAITVPSWYDTWRNALYVWYLCGGITSLS
jgi:hypothetical protein